MFGLFAVAYAQQGALVLPNAGQQEAGQGHAGIAVGLLVEDRIVEEQGVSVGGAAAATDRIAFDLRTFYYSGTFRGFLGARFLLVDGDWFRLAPWVGVGAATHFHPGWDSHLSLMGAPGFALEAGGERVWFDASVPIVGVPILNVTPPRRPSLLFVVLLASEVGGNVEVSDRHFLRLGMTILGPSLTWRWLGEHVYTELHVSKLFDGLLVGGGAGARF